MKLNREQRRRLEENLNLQINETLPEYFDHPNKSVRRADLWAIVNRIITLRELHRKRNRWYNRLWRWWLGLWGTEPEELAQQAPDPEEVMP